MDLVVPGLRLSERDGHGGVVESAQPGSDLGQRQVLPLEALDERDPLQLPGPIVLPRTGRRSRDEALGDVVADGPGRDVRASRELRQRKAVQVAGIIHGPILTLLRSTVNTGAEKKTGS